MATRFWNFGVEFDNDDQEKQMEDFVFKHGKYIEGYHGKPYINYEFGSMQVILRTAVAKIEEGTKYLAVTGGDTHIRGNSIWKVRSLGIDATPDDADITEKRDCFCNASTNEGFVVINIVNADVLPSYRRDEIIEMQVLCFPHRIEYFDAEKNDVDEENLRGICRGLESGEIYSSGFRHNHSKQTPEEDIQYAFDDIVEIRATVMEISRETTYVCDMGKAEYIRCTVETDFGLLDVIHSEEQVEENQRDNIKEGSTVYVQGIISADVAIYDYEHGIIADEDNNYKLLRDVIEGSDISKLESMLDDDAVYVSDRSEETFKGKAEVIDRLLYVQENGPRYIAFWADITGVDEGASLPYFEGTKCLVIRNEDNGDYESIVFMDLSETGKIKRIHACAEERYRFEITAPPDPIDLYYRYDPDGIAMILPYACIGMDRFFSFGEELMHCFKEIDRPDEMNIGYKHEYAYVMNYIDDICFCVRYRLDDDSRRATHDLTIPLGRNDRSIWDSMIAMHPMGSGPDYCKGNAVLRKKDDGKGIAVVELVNGDICPNYMVDDEIKLRVTAFPEYISYYADEDEYAEDMHTDEDGRINTISNGVVLPAFFLRSHSPENRKEQNFDRDNINYILGEVIEVKPGEVTLKTGNEQKAHFTKCIIATEFGELEILHTDDMVAEKRRQNIKPGALVYGAFRLYGNPAVDKYANGIVYDEENNLKKLREVLVSGEADGLTEISDPDIEVYFDGKSMPGIVGRKETIEYLKDSHRMIDTNPAAEMATIMEVTVDDNHTKIPGKRCVAFSEDDEEGYTSLWFIDVNNDGRISRMTYSVSDGYRFRIDPKPEFKFDDTDLDNQQIH